MNRVTAVIVAIVTLCVIAIVCVTLGYQFGGQAQATFIAAVFGFVTPTIAALFALAQSVLNAEKTDKVGDTVDAVNKKVNGHLARLTQVVVDNAASGGPIDPATVAALASHTAVLTGETINLSNPKEGHSNP